MATKVIIKQFKNKAKKPVAGLTPEHAVYDKNGVRLDAKLGNVDLSEFRRAQEAGVNAINATKDNNLTTIEEARQAAIISIDKEGSSYNDRLNLLENQVNSSIKEGGSGQKNFFGEFKEGLQIYYKIYNATPPIAIYGIYENGTYDSLKIENSNASGTILLEHNYVAIRFYSSKDYSVELSISSTLKIQLDSIDTIVDKLFNSRIKLQFAKTLSTNGIIKDYKVILHKGDRIYYNLSITGTAHIALYAIKSVSPFVYTTIADTTSAKEGYWTVLDDDFIILRYFANSSEGEYSINNSITVIPEVIANLISKIDNFQVKTKSNNLNEVTINENTIDNFVTTDYINGKTVNNISGSKNFSSSYQENDIVIVRTFDCTKPVMLYGFLSDGTYDTLGNVYNDIKNFTLSKNYSYLRTYCDSNYSVTIILNGVTILSNIISNWNDKFLSISNSINANSIDIKKIYNRVGYFNFKEVLNKTGIIKDIPIFMQKGDCLKYKYQITSGNATRALYLIRTETPLSYIALDPNNNSYIAEEDTFIILRFYITNANEEYEVDYSYEIIPKRISNIQDYIDEQTMSIKGQTISGNGQHNYYYSYKSGDFIKIIISSKSSPIACYGFKEDDTYDTFGELNNEINIFTINENYKFIRLYSSKDYTSTLYVNSISVDKEVLPKIKENQTNIENINLQLTKENIKEDSFIVAGDKTGIIKDYPISINKDDAIQFNVEFTKSYYVDIYLIKSEKPLVFRTISSTNVSTSGTYEFSNDGDEDYKILRVYKTTSTDEEDVIKFSYNIIDAKNQRFKKGILDVVNEKVDAKIDKLLPKNSDLTMCLPNKIFAVKGLSYNIYKDSICLNPNTPVDLITYPKTETNFQADNIQIGKVSKITNIKDCIFRIALDDNNAINSKLTYKDLSVEWNDVLTPITKKVNIIGDSITNRGSGYFANKAAEHINCSIIGFGTMNNYGNYSGEGREGWTTANFIGKSTLHMGSTRINVMASGTSGTLYTNPFMREANSTDLANYPQWCFPNTGVHSEKSYAEDSTQDTYYIFDYEYYLNRWTNANIPDVVTIALGTNDIIRGWNIEEDASFYAFMVERIKAAVPNVKIGVLPSPAWGITYSSFSTRIVPFIEAIKAKLSSYDYVDIIGLWCFMDRRLAFGLYTNPEDKTIIINPSTNQTEYRENVHFDTGDGGKKAYLEYGKVLASFILNK